MAYMRNPLVTIETYKHLIEFGLTQQTIISITVPNDYVRELIATYKGKYGVLAGAARAKNRSRLTVYNREMIREGGIR